MLVIMMKNVVVIIVTINAATIIQVVLIVLLIVIWRTLKTCCRLSENFNVDIVDINVEVVIFEFSFIKLGH